MDILQIGASVTLDQFQAGLDRAEADTKHAAKGMSDAFQALAADSEQASSKILAASVRVSEASIALAQSKDQVRIAMREAKAAGDDDVVALARLALAQKAAADAAKQLAEAQAKLGEQAQITGGGIQEWIEHPFQAAGELAKSFAESLGPIGIAAFGTVAGLTALGVEAVRMTLEMATSTRQAENMAERLGLTAGQAQQLGAEARLVGVDVNTMGVAARILGQVLDDPTSKQSANARTAIERLGVSMYTASGATRELGPVLLDVLNALSAITEDSTRAAEAQALFGRGGKELLPLIKNHQDLREVVKQLGVGLDEDENQQLLKVFDSTQRLGIAWEELKKTFAARIAPIIIPIELNLTHSLQGATGNNQKDFLPEFIKPQEQKTREAIDDFLEASKKPLDDLDKFGKLTQKRAGEALASGFKAAIGNTTEGLKNQLSAIKQERAKLESQLSSGDLSPDVFAAKKNEYDEKGAKEKQLEAQLKGVQRSRQIRLQEIDAIEADQKAQLEVERAGIEAEARLHEINDAGRLAKLAAVKAKERQIEENAIQQKIGVYRNDPEHPEKVAEMQGQLDAIRSKGTASAINSQSEILAAQIKAIENEVKEHDKAEQESRKIRDKEADDALKASQKIAEDKDKAQDLELTGELAHQKALNVSRKERADTDLAGGNITQQQHAKILTSIENQEFASEKKILDQRLAAITAGGAGELAARQKVLNEIQALQDQHNLNLEKIDKRYIEKAETDWNNLQKSMERQSVDTVSAIITGHERLSIGFARLTQQMLSDWIQFELRRVITHLANTQAIQAAENAMMTVLRALHLVSATTEKATDTAKNVAAVTSEAGVAAATAYAYWAWNPPIAASMAAEAFAATIAFAPVASAAGGMLVDDDQLAYLHKNEMVLPSQYSQTIQNITSGGGGGGGGGTVNIGMHFTDGAGARRFWSQGKNNIKSVVKQMVREGAFKK